MSQALLTEHSESLKTHAMDLEQPPETPSRGDIKGYIEREAIMIFI